MYTSYSLAIRAVERISFVQNFDFNCTKSMAQLKVSFNHDHSLKLPHNNAKSFRETKHLSTTQTDWNATAIFRNQYNKGKGKKFGRVG